MSLTLSDLTFRRPESLQATEPPEVRLGSRDAVRLLVSTKDGHHGSRFANLANFLEPGDLLVVNRSATLPASLPAEGGFGPFLLNLSTRYGNDQSEEVWLAEPRWSFAQPGPLPLSAGERVTVAGLRATLLHPYPGLPRLRFVRFGGDVGEVMRRFGAPIRYGYVKKAYPLETYQTLFAQVTALSRAPRGANLDLSGSAEMPSAARPFTERVLRSLAAKGVGVASLTLHTGVSSLEVTEHDITRHPLPSEPFEVPPETAERVAATKAAGGRVIAVGTTVVRALESAWDGALRPARGFTRLYLHPGRAVNVVDGLLTGFHDPKASHLAMLYAVAGKDLVQSAYEEAVRGGYLWHEFGDSHLILPSRSRGA